jgi:hypothetical protein
MSENSIGIVHWEALNTGTDGEAIVLIIPAFFQSHHVPYLTSVLESRLDQFFDLESVSISLIAGERTRTSYEEGTIVIRGVTEPWPDAGELREALDAAFEEAGHVEEEQRRRATELFKHLRSDGR